HRPPDREGRRRRRPAGNGDGRSIARAHSWDEQPLADQRAGVRPGRHPHHQPEPLVRRLRRRLRPPQPYQRPESRGLRVDRRRERAGGVVLITTRHGSPGKAQWRVYAEQGAIVDNNDYPAAFRGWRSSATDTSASKNSRPTNGTQCILTQVASGACVQDSVSRFNLFKDPQTTPLGTGHRQQYGVQVSGGSDAVRYYVSGEWEDELGQTKMPQFADSIVRAIRQISEVPGDQRQPNALRRVSIRA